MRTISHLIKTFFSKDRESFYNGEKGKFTDKNGKFIKVGDKAIVIDRNGKEWHGEIVKTKEPVLHTTKHEKVYKNFLAFHSNYNIALWQYWTSKKLEVKRKISKYELINKF